MNNNPALKQLLGLPEAIAANPRDEYYLD